MKNTIKAIAIEFQDGTVVRYPDITEATLEVDYDTEFMVSGAGLMFSHVEYTGKGSLTLKARFEHFPATVTVKEVDAPKP
jgi:hypothetical protein